MKFEIREIKFGTNDYKATLELRYKILREPLGLTFSQEELEPDKTDLHIGAFYDGELIGCLILAPKGPGIVRMRQVAILENRQGQGIGKKLVKFSEELLIQKGIKEIVLNARKTAIPFYLKLGYEITGEPFEEVRIPHSKMRKILI